MRLSLNWIFGSFFAMTKMCGSRGMIPAIICWYLVLIITPGELIPRQIFIRTVDNLSHIQVWKITLTAVRVESVPKHQLPSYVVWAALPVAFRLNLFTDFGPDQSTPPRHRFKTCHPSLGAPCSCKSRHLVSLACLTHDLH